MNESPEFKYAPFTNPNTNPNDAVAKLPTPAAYRQSVPTFSSTEPETKTRRFERKRLIRWFAVAVALHAALFLGIWLTPPLRLKWSPDPEQWVSVTSLPMKVPEAPALDVAKATKPSPTKAKGHKATSAVEPSAAQPPRTE
jgi:hypothetical protein